MQTPASPASSRQHADTDVMITTDIEITVDLEEPPTATAPALQRARPEPAPPPQPARQRPVANVEPRLPIAPGRVLCDRYVLTQIISMGGTYTVFRARDLEATPASGKPAFVALKTPRSDHPDRTGANERLQREFEHARRLSHSGIAAAFELASEGEAWFMTMELFEGESLASLMRRHGSAFPTYLTRRVLRGISDALAYAHAAGIAHGDLNPENVFVLAGDRIKLIGFSSGAREGSTTSAAALACASPQVLEGETAQISDDVFSFACIAYELATGRHPFQQRPANAARAEGLRPESPAALGTEQTLALLAALSFERDARPRAIKDLAKTLAPDPQRTRTVVFEPELEAPAPERHGETRWWLFAAACLIAMVGAVAFTRLLS